MKNNYDISWVCKTTKTQKEIQWKYGISVLLNYKDLFINNYNLIIISLPPAIQWQVSLNILKTGYKWKIIIEIPVTWNKYELKEIKKYNNAYFYLEEYYTLLSKFLRKIDIRHIWKIHIEVFTSQLDYENLKARQVTYIHIKNNFLGLDIPCPVYDFKFHDNENIFYKIKFIYKEKNIEYNFRELKYLKIWDRKIIDNYNFDRVLEQVIESDKNFNNYYILENVR